MVHAAMLRSPHAHARIRSIDTSRGEKAPGVAGRLHRQRRGHRPEGRAVRVAAAQRQPQDRRLRLRLPRTVRYVGDIVAVVVAETPYQAYDALDLIVVDYEPLPSVIDPELALKAGAAAAACRRAEQRGVPLGVRRRRRRRRVQERRGGRQGTDHPAAPHPERDGAARGARAVERRLRRTDRVEHDAESAHPPVPELGGHRRPGRQAAGDCAGSRRRLRQQDRRVPGRLHHDVLRDEAGPSGQVERDAQRELPGDDARPGSRAGSRARGEEGRDDSRPARHVVVRHGRLPFDRGARASRPSCTA